MLLGNTAGGYDLVSTSSLGIVSGGSSFGYPFPGNATGTQIAFNGGATFAGATTSAFEIANLASSTNLVVSSLGGAGTACVQADASGKLSSTGAACGTGSGAVNSVSNSDGTLTISPTTGAVVASLNPAHANAFTALQQFNAGASTTVLSARMAFFGGTATTTINSAGDLAVAGSTTLSGILNSLVSNVLASTTLSGNTLLTNATTTTFAIINVSGQLLKTLTNGAVVAAVANTDYTTPSALASAIAASYPFPGNATSTQIAFNGGATFTGATTTALAVTGSSTINTLNLSNALTVGNGGTGSTTLTGLLKGNGTGSLLTAAAGTDYQAPLLFTYPLSNTSNTVSLAFGTTTANTFSQLNTFNGGVTANVLTVGTSASIASTTLAGNTLLSFATTTNLAITNISGQLLKTLSNGAVVAAIAGTDYLTSATTFAYPFPSNATSTTLAFNGGFTTTGATSTGTFGFSRKPY